MFVAVVEILNPFSFKLLDLPRFGVATHLLVWSKFSCPVFFVVTHIFHLLFAFYLRRSAR